MILKNQVGHVLSERDFHTEAEEENPWIVTLHYSFQVSFEILDLNVFLFLVDFEVSLFQ